MLTANGTQVETGGGPRAAGPGGRGPRFGSRYAPRAKPKDARGTVRRLLRALAGHRAGLVASVALSGVVAAVPVLSPLVIGRAVDLLGAGSPVAGAVGLLLALTLGEWAVRTLQGLTVNTLGQRAVRDIRAGLFDAMAGLPLSFFDRHPHGELMSRVTNDADSVASTLSTAVSQLMVLAFTVGGMFCAMLALSPALTAVILVPVGLMLLWARAVARRARPLFVRQQEALGRLNALVEESVTGMSLVRAFGRQRRLAEDFDRANGAYRRAATSAQTWSGALLPVSNVISNLAFIAVAVAGGAMAARGQVEVGLVTSFLLYAKRFTRPFVEFATMYNDLQAAIAGAERVFAVEDAEPEPADRPGAAPLSAPRGAFVLDHVGFGYEPGRPVLHDLRLDVPAGTRVAVVGATGSGKTTLTALLARLYDVTSGSIRLDGRDLRDYRLADLRRAFSVVPQDAVLMSTSVLANICYGRPDLLEEARGGDGGRALEEARRVAREVGADQVVEHLPQGYATVLEGGGERLSLGERQLVSIARAMLADAPIVILDEATSSVDTVTEARIRAAVLKLTEGRTSFTVAHRLATVRDSDLIVVLDQGRIAETGTHDALLARGGLYAEMWRAQTGEK